MLRSATDLGRCAGLSAGACLLGLCLALLAGPAQADKVGVAAAVNPDAFSSLSGKPDKQLNIGKSIFYNERINTTGSGLVQVLLMDGSTFTVGPNSDLIIDKFVYDPNKKSGEILATFSKGSMRFIGGKISKNEGGVKVNTPAGALAIRGGMFQGHVSGRKGTFSFLYGVSLTYTGSNGRTQTVYQPGYTLDTSSGAPTVRPTTSQDTNFFAKAFSGGGTVVVGGTETQSPNPDAKIQLTETVSLQDLISDATATQINDTLEQEETQEDKAENNNPSSTTQSPPTTGTPPPTTTSLTFRVLTPPSDFTAYGEPIRFPSDKGILGGDENPAVQTDDFVWTFRIVNGRLVGTVTGLLDSASGEDNESQTAPMTPTSINFPAVLECVTNIGICGVTDATVTQNGETKTYSGWAALRKGFYAYQVIDNELLGSPLGDINGGHFIPDGGGESTADFPEIVLAFGGTPYKFGTPRGRTFGFFLAPDFLQDVAAPFASYESMPYVDDSTDESGNFIKPQPFVTPLLYKEADDSNADNAVWLQTSLYINTTPADEDTEFNQQSFVNIALGGIDSETGGLIGTRRGGASIDFESCIEGCSSRENLAFTGDIASLAGPDGTSHFLGTKQPNIVIGFDSTDTHNIGRDLALDDPEGWVEADTGSAYHIGAGLGVLEPQEQSFEQSYWGYAAGIVRSEVPAEDFVNVVAGKSAEDFEINFNPDANTLWANLTVFDVQHADSATAKYELNFGDIEGSENRSAYLDNSHYAAIESGAEVSNWDDGEFDQYDYADSTSYIVSGDQLGATQFFPDTFDLDEDGNRPICLDCNFIKWGAWGTRVTFGNDGGSQYTDDVHLGWWVAGDVTTTAELDDLWLRNASAEYHGNAIADVANKIGRDDWATYVATGKLYMDWNFRSRDGSFEISKFDKANFGGDGLTFSGQMNRPGDLSNHFSGTINGQLPGNLGSLTGDARGSFVNDLQGNPARGVIGNWDVKNSSYRATGIFAGSGRPIIPNPQ